MNRASHSRDRSPGLGSRLSALGSTGGSRLQAPASRLGGDSRLQAPGSRLGGNSKIAGSIPTPDLSVDPRNIINHHRGRFCAVVGSTSTSCLVREFLYTFTRTCSPRSTCVPPAHISSFRVSVGLGLYNVNTALRTRSNVTGVIDIVTNNPTNHSAHSVHLERGSGVFTMKRKSNPIRSIIRLPLSGVIGHVENSGNAGIILRIVSTSSPDNGAIGIISLVHSSVGVRSTTTANEMCHIASPLHGKDATRPERHTVNCIGLPDFCNSTPSGPSRPSFHDTACSVGGVVTNFGSRIRNVVLSLHDGNNNSLHRTIRLINAFVSGKPMILMERPSKTRPVRSVSSSMTFHGPLIMLVSESDTSTSRVITTTLRSCNETIVINSSGDRNGNSIRGIVRLFPGGRGCNSVGIAVTSFRHVSNNSARGGNIRDSVILPSVVRCVSVNRSGLPGTLP